MFSGNGSNSPMKEGWLLVRADAKNKSKTFAKNKFKKHYVIVSRNQMVIKKSMDGKSIRTVDLAKSMVGFQNDAKSGNYIRVANPGYVLELKPEGGNPNAINSWMIAFQSNQNNMDLTGKQRVSASSMGSPRESLDGANSPSLFGKKSPSKMGIGGSNQWRSQPNSSSSIGSFHVSPKKASTRASERKFMEIMVSKLEKESLGMKICGGVAGNPEKPEVYVHTIAPGGLAERNKMCVGDIIVHVNHRKFNDVTIEAASTILSKSYGLVAIGVNRKHGAVPGITRQDSEVMMLNSLPKAAEPPQPQVQDEVFGFPMSDDEDDAGSPDNTKNNSNNDTTTTSTTTTTTTAVVEEPHWTPQTVADDEAKKAEEEPKPAVDLDARAARLAKMKEARAKKRNSVEYELDAILAVIDNLDEDA